MPIYEVNGRKANVKDESIDKFLKQYPNAQLVDSAPYYLSRANSTPRESNISKQNDTPVEEIPSQQPNNGISGGFTTFQDGTTGIISGMKMPEIKIEQPNLGIPKSEITKGTPFESKSFQQAISDTMQKMREKRRNDSNYIVQSAIEEYQREKDWINNVNNDPNTSPEVKASLNQWHKENVRDTENVTDDVRIPQLVRDYLDNNKKTVSKSVYVPGSPMFGGGMWVDGTAQENTPEQMALIADFLVNSPKGRLIVEDEKLYLKRLDENIDNLEKEIRETSKKRREAIPKTIRMHDYLRMPKRKKEEFNKEWGAIRAEVEKQYPFGDLINSENQLNELKKLRDAYHDGDKGAIKQLLKEFGRRLPYDLANAGSLGIIGLTEQDALSDALENPQNVLTRKGYNLVNQYQQAHEIDRSIAQDIARGTTQTLPFISQFAATGGITPAAGRGIISAASKVGLNAEKIAALGSGINKSTRLGRGLSTAGNIGKTLSIDVLDAGARSLIMPTTYSNALARTTDNQGSFLDNFAHSWFVNTIENYSEKFGSHLPGWKVNHPKLKKAMDITGVQGYPEEFAEEQLSMVLNSLFQTGEAEWSDLVDPRNQLVTAGTIGMIQVPYLSIRAGGYSAAKFRNLKQKRSINKGYRENIQNIEKLFGEEANSMTSYIDERISSINDDAELETSINGFMVNVMNDVEMSEEQKDAILKYTMASLAKSSLETGKNEQVQQAQEEAAQVVQENSNPQMYAVVSAVIGGYDNPMQVIGGNIVQNEDGSINRDLSDQSVTIIDAEGKRVPVSIKFVESISENIPTQEAVNQASQIVTKPIIARQENEEVRPYEVGEVVTADAYGNGIPFTGEVTGVTKDGKYIIVGIQSGQQMIVEPRQIINQDNIQGVEDGSLIEYRNEKGEVVQGVIGSMYALRPQGMIALENGEAVAIEDVIGLAKDANIENPITGQNADNLQSNIQQNVGASPAEQSNVSYIERIPQDEKGNLLFDQVPVETTIGALSEVYNDVSELSGVVDATINNIQKQIDKAKAPKPIGDINKDIANKRASNQQLEELSNRLSYWEGVRNSIEQSRPLGQRITEQVTGEEKVPEESVNAEKNNNFVENDQEDEQRNKIPERISQERHGRINEVDREVEERTTDNRGRETPTSEARQIIAGKESKREQLNALESYAKEKGIWIDNTSVLGEQFSEGGENEVFYTPDTNSVFKLNNFEYAGDDVVNFFDRIDAHNTLFPKVHYALIGFAKNSKGETSAVLKQPYVSEADRLATPEEIANFMRSIGFERINEDTYTNNDYEVFDAFSNNVLLGVDGLLYPIDTQIRKNTQEQTIQEKITEAEAETDTNPTEAQKEAGNYKKGKVTIQGFDISIEQPQGSVRSGVDENGKQWSVTMNNTYGYIRKTEGKDGDYIDVFLGDNPESNKVFVIDQVNPTTGQFDEHKVMLGFNSALSAKRAYLSNYEKGWQGLGNITEVSLDNFKKWIDSSHRKTKPFADYKSAGKTEDDAGTYKIQGVSDIKDLETYVTELLREQGAIEENNPEEYAEAYDALVNSDRYAEYIKGIISDNDIQYLYDHMPVKTRKQDLIDFRSKLGDAGIELEDVVDTRVKRTGRRPDQHKDSSKHKDNDHVGKAVTIKFLDGTYVKGVIEKVSNGNISVRSNSNNRLYTVRENAIVKDTGIRFRTTVSEEESFIERSKADGTYMKAPNGKPTNLNEKQWIQVRSKAFKEWFGDWERASRINKLRESKAVEITGEEITPSDDLKQYKKNALEYGKGLQGEYTNKDTGNIIQLQRGRRNGGVNEVLQHDYKDAEHLQSIAAIPQIIENSLYIDSRENLDTDKNPDVKEYQYYVCGLKIGNEDYTVRSTIAVDKNGNRYYDHKLAQIEKGKLLDQINDQAVYNVGFGTTPGTKPTTDSSLYKDKILFSLLQANSSKVVDENGEPLVVYHGTTSDKETKKWNNLLKSYDSLHEPFTVFRRTNDGERNSGHFFNSDMQNAYDYGYNTYDVYLDLRNPMVIDAKGFPYSEIEYNGEKRDTYEWSAYAEKNGHDGVIFQNIRDGVDYNAMQTPTTDYVAFNSNQIKSATDNTGTFSMEDNDIRFREVKEDERFNKELQLYKSGKMGANDMFHLGMPRGAMLAFLPELPIVMHQKTVRKGSEKKHDVDVLALENMTSLISSPIFVFQRDTKTIGILTEMKDRNDKNVCVAIEMNRAIKDGKQILEVNDVRSVHGRRSENIVFPILNNGTLRWVDKEKGIDWISSVNPDESQEISDQHLSDITKIVENFENPTIEQGKIASEVDNLSDKLNTLVHVIRNVDEIVDSNTDLERKKRGSKGWYDRKTGEVFFVLPNAENIADAQATVLHEVVGHKGLRGLLGDKFDDMLYTVFKDFPDTLKSELTKEALKNYSGDIRIPVEEFLARCAEEDIVPSFWEKIKASLKAFFRSLGIDLKISDNDIRYMLWKSKNRIMKGDTLDEALKKTSNEMKLLNSVLFRDGGPTAAATPVKNANNSAMTKDVRNQLDRELKQFRNRLREQWEDRHLPVKIFLDTLRKNGVNIAEYNDYYKQATHINGKIDAQLEHYNEAYQRPLNKAISNLEKAGFDYRAIENYTILKHGLERNAWMREDAINQYKLNNPEATQEQIDKFAEKLPDDYSGITAVQEEIGMSAENFISEFENKAGNKLINDLWQKIKAATTYSLQKQKEGGLINKKTFDELTSRYEYYIPLRGHDAEVAEDRWDYSPNMGTYFVAPLIKAKGRKTRSESPFAYIFSMAQSSINSANRNLLNQTILRLAMMDKTKLLGVNKVWYVQSRLNEKGKPVYEVQSPTYSENPEQYEKNITEFEERMQKMAEAGLAVQSGSKLDIGGLFIKRNQAEQHEVHIYQNGTEYVVYINANPAVARAITGANAKDLHKDLRFIARISRQMAANFTTRNPIFVLSNFSRDYIFASSILPVKEDAKYAIQFQRNMLKSAGALQRYIRGKADLTKQQDRYVIEYIMNGAKTGFSHIVELQKIQKQIEREIKKGDNKSVFRHTLDALESCNEFAENLSRLSVYITSREQGRSIVQSVSDAKKVTVNFNRNGAGGWGAAWFRSLYLFVNAGIQALSNFVKVAQKNKGKIALLISSYAMSGFLMPMLAALIGGDDGLDEYMKLSDWERQNNLCLYTGNGFIKIPLPHELRVFHAMGDNIYQASFGKKDVTESILDVILGFSDLIPANPMGSIQGSWADIMPDATKPFFQLAANKNFTGSQITKENQDKDKPGYLKIRTNKKGQPYAPAFLVKLGESLDSATGGDGVEKGLISFNPDEVNHILRGYFGGLYGLGMNVLSIGSKTVDTMESGEIKVKATDFIPNAFYKSADDLLATSSGLNSKYFKIADDIQETRRKIKGYQEQATKGQIGVDKFAEKIQGMANDVEKYKRIYPLMKQIKKYETALKELDSDHQKEAEKIISNLKKEVIEINSIMGK